MKSSIRKTLKKVATRKVPGMTLIELLLVLALIGILLSLAVPRLLPLIGRTKSLEAKMQLQHLLSLQKNYFYINSRYSTDLAELGFEQEKLVIQGGKANYRIEMVKATNNQFVATAVAVTDFDGDGIYNEWQLDQSEDIQESVKD